MINAYPLGSSYGQKPISLSPTVVQVAITDRARLAADGWNDELHGVDAQRIARKFLYPAYEMRLEDALAVLVLGLVNHRIGENNHIATPEIFAVNPVLCNAKFLTVSLTPSICISSV